MRAVFVGGGQRTHQTSRTQWAPAWRTEQEATGAPTICLFGETTTAGVSRDEIRDKKCRPPPTHSPERTDAANDLHLAGTQTHIPSSSPRAHAPRVTLTAEDRDGDGLFLLDGLRVGEAGVADVVVTGILWEHVGEVEVSVEGLGHPAALRQLLEV